MLRHENISFFRALEVLGESGEDGKNGKNAEKIPSFSSKRAKYAVTLAAFRSIAITPFSFPFNNVLRVREALKLQTLPYAVAGEMELFPSIIEKTQRASKGIGLYIPSGELKNPPAVSPKLENRVWPAPLPLVSQIGGEGVVLWLDEENICSMLWRGSAPVLYRWKPRSSASADSELSWYELYCKAKGEEIGNVFVMDAASQGGLDKFADVAKDSLALCPWIGDVNISRSAIASAMVLEKNVRSLSKAASWILMIGLVVLAGNGLRYYEARNSLNALRTRTTEFYRSEFEPSRTGPIPDPIELARYAVEQLKGDFSEGRSIVEMLSELGEIFEQNRDMDVTLDITLYGSEGANYTGSAPDLETAQRFSAAWAEKAGSTQLGNMIRLPDSSGYRFDLNVKW